MELAANASLADFSSASVMGGTVRRLSFTSPGARGLGVSFSKFAMQQSSLYVMSADGKKVRGAFTAANEKAYGGMAVTPVGGAALTLEVHTPAGTPLPTLQVQHIVHHYKHTPMLGKNTDVKQGYGDSGACNINAQVRAQLQELAAAPTQTLHSSAVLTLFCSPHLQCPLGANWTKVHMDPCCESLK